MEGGTPKVLVNEEGARTTPSVVAFTKDGEKLVGQIAKRQAVTNPENTIYSAKRFIGRRVEETTEETKFVPYKVIKNGNDSAFEVRGKKVTPEEISAAILGKLKKVAEDYLVAKSPKRHHCSGVLQRCSTASDQRRRPYCWSRREAHHQRADRGRTCLWTRQKER